MSTLQRYRARLAGSALILAGLLVPLTGCEEKSTSVAPVSESEAKAKADAEAEARRKAYGASGVPVAKKGGLAQPKGAAPAAGAESK